MLTIGLLLPELLGTYGDSGNARVLAHRVRARSLPAEIVVMKVGESLPEADVYVLGGGEDGPQRLACDLLRASDLVRRVNDGAHLFAVCAGLQIIGTSFAVAGSDNFEGLGLIDAVTQRGQVRSVGDLALSVGDAVLVGFENHGGVTTLGEGVRPLGAVCRGRGNDGESDGVRTQHIWATYAHGPALAMNPWLADEILSAALGRELDPYVSVADRLHLARRQALGL